MAEATRCEPENARGVRWPSATPELVDALLRQTLARGASDLHLLPTAEGLVAQLRLDGVMQPLAVFPPEASANVVARLKVLAGLLTYETNRPQEGRLRLEGVERAIRLCTMPTVSGERVVARVLPRESAGPAAVERLGLPADVAAVLDRSLRQTSGLLLLVGPSGSGKTTTAYACLRRVLERSGGGRSVASLEDPVEAVVPGVAQSQVNDHAGFDLSAGLRALVRLDPEVIFVGEVRDAETARIAYQAAMTGQLVVTTFHAGDAATALARLLDMGAPPYMVRSATRAIVAQRLLRRVCECRRGGAVVSLCEACNGLGYSGRAAIAEAVDLTAATLAETIRDGYDRRHFTAELRQRRVADLREQAAALVAAGVTDAAEVDRVLGWEAPPG